MDRFEPQGRATLILVVPPGSRIDEFGTVLDIHDVKKWEIPDSAPLYTLAVPAE
jgi:hypothetical protein